jgi:small subunit ribosomal protein S6
MTADQLAAVKAKIEDIIVKGNGQIVRVEERGRQKLAYPVRKELYGYYILYDYRAQANLASELERNLKIDEKVFKFLTLVQDKNFSDERYQAVLENLANEASRREKELIQAQDDKESLDDSENSGDKSQDGTDGDGDSSGDAGEYEDDTDADDSADVDN